MNYYKLIIAYKGTHFFGWQIQAQGERTVQGVLNECLDQIFKEKVKTTGSGRTDTGVHALCQVVKVETTKTLDPKSLMLGLNSILPLDIQVLASENCDENFRPTNDCKIKEYHYYFTTDKRINPLVMDLIAEVNFDLNINLMKKAAKEFEGEHDFKNYQCVGTPVNSTIREIYSCEILAVEKFFNITNLENIYVLKISGNGFLKQMVRQIMGTLWEVGKGHVTQEEIRASLLTPNSLKLGHTAAAKGLYLAGVTY